jgi:AAA domain
VPRLIVAGADLDLVYRIEVITGGHAVGLSLPVDIGGLSGEITRTGAALLSVDPLVSALSSGIDTHRDSEVRTALEPLGRLADSTGAAILGNAHFSKGSGTNPLALILGSAAFANASRAALAFARDDSTGAHVLSVAKQNLGRTDLPSLAYEIEDVILDTDEGPAHVGRLRFTAKPVAASSTSSATATPTRRNAATKTRPPNGSAHSSKTCRPRPPRQPRYCTPGRRPDSNATPSNGLGNGPGCGP